MLKTSNLTLKRKQLFTPREGNLGNVLLISRIRLQYFYQCMHQHGPKTLSFQATPSWHNESIGLNKTWKKESKFRIRLKNLKGIWVTSSTVHSACCCCYQTPKRSHNKTRNQGICFVCRKPSYVVAYQDSKKRLSSQLKSASYIFIYRFEYRSEIPHNNCRKSSVVFSNQKRALINTECWKNAKYFL